ncbi:unnamed protein product [Peronospora farinosa]|uniref:Secreted RxLR effector peptide protein n=1 Tax=Peronospora farinosa TaxID=134698 RepID=A0AAV0T979_9STRA|nr:unnamed protein product [Peronospora farinosa]CAH0485577.1 unnamed protein product [Peronospora farinosa]CAI5705325.1 unnamed protein product [Peronospora farinosa]CAI5705327.1 unnamed protein product [Peronospora farinosa]CAI5717051.1 unnamed protein product [Peronospora farinosa]
MPVKPKKTSLTKALFVIMLVVCSPFGMAMADLLPEDALRTFWASDTLNMDLIPPPLKHKRYLRSTADVTTTSTGELRRLVPDLSGLKELGSSFGKQAVGFPARLRQSVLTIYSKIMTRMRAQWWLWVNKQRNPEEVFESLQLVKEGKSLKNPFENPNFPVWKYIVGKTTPKEDVPKVMFDIMVKKLGDEGQLDRFLAQTKSSAKFGYTVKSICNYRIKQWVEKGYTSENRFNYLELNKFSKFGEIPHLPGFSMWAAFNTEKNSVYEAFEFLKGSEGRTMNLDLMRALAKIGKGDANFEFAQGLLLSQLQFMKKKPKLLESTFELFKLQGKKTSNPTDLTTDLLGRLWVDFVYMRTQGKTSSIRCREVYKKLSDKVGHGAALKVMKQVHRNGFFLKSLEKENPIKGDKDFSSFMKKLRKKME